MLIMLNCKLLLDSAIRFGLEEGTLKLTSDAREADSRVSFLGV